MGRAVNRALAALAACALAACGQSLTENHPAAAASLRTAVLAVPGVESADVTVARTPESGRRARVEARTEVDAAAGLGAHGHAALLTALAHLAWDNDAFVADSIGVYLDTGADVMLDLTTVGFAHSTPRNDALFERFGPPAVDPDWEP